MARESSQAALEREGCLARMSRWATTGLVIPLLTALSFAVSTVYLVLIWGPRFFPFLVSEPWPLPWPVAPIFCLILGFGLGFPLRWAMRRIRATGRPIAGIPVVAGVGLAWCVAASAQLGLILILTL